jgi:hypothetical protein
MQKPDNQFTDGFASLERGMDSGRAPSLLARNQYALGINTTVRGGYITHRPGLRRLSISHLGSDGATDATLESRATSGRWQGAGYYCPPNRKAGFVYCVSGRQFMLRIGGEDTDDHRVFEITPGAAHADVNNPEREQSWILQAEDFCIIQNNQDKPIIYNGASSRRSNLPNKEVPVGSVMAYGLGRLWVARGRDFVASDIVGGPSGTTRYGRRDAVLKFTENDYLNEGGTFRAPAPVTAMAFPSNLDTALGEGELTVFTRTGAVIVRVPASRDDWKNLSIPLQRTALKPKGATSQNSVVEVNSDLFFRADDGIRSFVMAQRSFGQWGNTPSSLEVRRVMDADDRRLLQFASSTLFDNRLLMTVSPVYDPTYGTYFRGLVALNFDSVSGMFEKLPPAYDGVWTGLNILQVVSGDFDGVERCFIFALSDEDTIEVWELTRDDYLDRYSRTDSTRIIWSFESSTMGFDDAAGGLKVLQAAQLKADRLRGSATFTIKYRPDDHPVWQSWSPSWTKQAEDEICEIEDCALSTPLPQQRTRMNLPTPTKVDESTNNQPLNIGHEFQFRVQVEGSCRIRQMRVRAGVIQERQDGGCPTDDATAVALTGCDEEIFSYQLTTPAEADSAVGGPILDDDGGQILDDDMNPILGD